MSTIEITVTENVTVDNFVEELAKGNVKFYTVRGNGTTRHIPVFVEGTPDFEKAEQVSEWREDGRTMVSIANELHMSVPSVRRLLNSFNLSDEVAGYEPEDIEELLAGLGEPVADSNEFIVGEVVAPSEAEGHEGEPKCSECSDILASGNVCAECAAKPFLF